MRLGLGRRLCCCGGPKPCEWHDTFDENEGYIHLPADMLPTVSGGAMEVGFGEGLKAWRTCPKPTELGAGFIVWGVHERGPGTSIGLGSGSAIHLDNITPPGDAWVGLWTEIRWISEPPDIRTRWLDPQGDYHTIQIGETTVESTIKLTLVVTLTAPDTYTVESLIDDDLVDTQTDVNVEFDDPVPLGFAGSGGGLRILDFGFSAFAPSQLMTKSGKPCAGCEKRKRWLNDKTGSLRLGDKVEAVTKATGIKAAVERFGRKS